MRFRPSRPKPPSDPASESAVRAVALRLLTVRARGAVDLSRTLERRGFEKGAVDPAIARLVDEGWLDDLAAARSVVRARSGRYGRARIARELAALGFSRETSNRAMEESGSTEEKALRKALEAAWAKSAGLSALTRQAARPRVAAPAGLSPRERSLP